MKIQLQRLICTVAAVLLLILTSCRSDEKEGRPVFPEGTTESVNLWVLDQMKRYYYWNGELPKNPNYSLSTPEFFKSIISKQDRFSFIVNTQDPGTYPRTVRGRFGFDYAVLQMSNGEAVTVIKLVLHNSPASNVGLKRGMVITKINGTAINAANVEALTKSIPDFNTLVLTVGDWQDNAVVNQKEITIYQGFTFDQPLIAKVFEKNGKKAGYLYIHDFSEGIAHSFVQKFAEFKAAGIQDLIVDLRYNYGGSVASAAALCALVVPGITPDKPFIKYVGNQNGGTVNKTFAEQIAFDTSAPPFATLQANALSVSRLYVLTSSNTASASEIVINNLAPYMNVIQIGTKTLGKDMAGFPVRDESSPKKIFWEIHPVIYKVYNANGEGNYTGGITPQISANEYEMLPLLPLGDPDETLLSKALGNSLGKSSSKPGKKSDVKQVLKESENQGIEVNRKNIY